MLRRPGYTSNYTERDREKGAALDLVVILGKDNKGQDFLAKHYEKIIADCEAKKLKYVILGNGKIEANVNDIDKLPKAKNAVVHAHGLATQNGHSILNEYTLDVTKKLQTQTGCKNFVYAACFSGQIANDIKQGKKNELEEGTSIAAFSAPDDSSFSADGNTVVDYFIYKIKLNEEIDMVSFVRDMAKIIPETIVFGHQSTDEFSSVTLSRHNRKIYDDTKRFLEYQQTLLNNFIIELLTKTNTVSLRKKIQNISLDEYKRYLETQSKVNAELVKAYQKGSFENHVLHNDIEVIDVLLKTNQFESELLFGSIKFSNNFPDYSLEKMVSLLLKNKNKAIHGLNPNVFFPGDHTHTPLTLALEAKNLKMVKVLLDNGANIFLADNEGRIPANILKSEKEVDSLYKDPLHEANNTVERIKQVYKYLNDTPFQKEATEVILQQKNFEQICSKENDMDFYYGKNSLPKNQNVLVAYLTYLIATRKMISQQDLLEYSINNKLTNLTVTLLSEMYGGIKYGGIKKAVESGNLMAVKEFKEYLNTGKNQLGIDKLLIIAAERGHVDILKELLKHGANINIIDDWKNQNLIDIVIDKGHLNILNVLLENGLKVRDVPYSFIAAVERGHIDIVTKMQELGANINQVDIFNNNNNNTALHVAAQYGHINIIKKLLHEGAHFQFNKKGQNPFHFALTERRIAAVRAFLSFDSTLINTPDNNGNLPLSIALQQDPAYSEGLKLLFKAGADYHSNNPLMGANLVCGDLSNVSLRSANLTDANLKFTNLSGSDLSNANFTNAKLYEANLSGSDLTNVNFTNADLTNAKLRDVKGLDITKLVMAKSLANVELDTNQLNAILNDKGNKKVDPLKLLKDKILSDHMDFFTKTNDIVALIYELVSIIKNDTHPLKFRRIGVSDYGNTTHYEKLVDSGRMKLVKLLNEPTVFEKLSSETKENLMLIVNTDAKPLENTLSFSNIFSLDISTNQQLTAVIKTLEAKVANQSSKKTL